MPRIRSTFRVLLNLLDAAIAVAFVLGAVLRLRRPASSAPSAGGPTPRGDIGVDQAPKREPHPAPVELAPVPMDGTPSPGRRRLLAALSLAAGGAGATIVGIPAVTVLLAPLLRQAPDVWRTVGPVTNFPIGPTTMVEYPNTAPRPWAGPTAMTAAWLRREQDSTFIAFSLACTHLGCRVRWEPGAELFMCPCHGGAFSKDGDVAAGPPPRPLERYPVRVRDGQVEIQTRPVPITR